MSPEPAVTAPLIIPFFIPHRGCPHHCIFCNQHLITAGPTAAEPEPAGPDPETVIETYLKFKGTRSRVELAFFGGNFLGLPRADIQALLHRIQPYTEAGVIQGIRCSTRPDTVTRERLNLVMPFGMTLVELGVQSMNDGVLQTAGRGHTRKDTEKAIQLLHRAGIKAGVQVMAGLPGDTPGSAIATCRELAKMKPDLARIYPALVLAGSRLAMWYKEGTYTPLRLDKAVDQVAEMWKVFAGAGVPVTRMGLQASEMLDDPSQVLAGPWHPAFGHLVYSALMYEQACNAVDALPGARPLRQVVLEVYPNSLSRLQGNRKANLEKLRRRYPGVAFRIRTDGSVRPGRVNAVRC